MNTIKPVGTAQKRRQIGLQALFLIGVALAGGCVSPNAAIQVKNFSAAVSLTASNSVQAYKLVEKVYFEKQLSETVLTCFAGTNIDLNAFNPRAFKLFLPTNELQVRLDVLGGLTTYAAQLSTLMGNPALNTLDQDTAKLGESLANLHQDLVSATFLKSNTVTSTEIDVFTTGINFIGHWLITRKEQKEAKLSIESMQKCVPDICRLLAKDFDYLRGELDKDYEDTEKNANQFLKINALYMDPIQRRAELEREVALARAMETADAALAGNKASIEKLASAHKALSEAFEKDTSNLKSLIGEVSGEGQRVAAYYGSLPTNN
jgi:hypothetical protein